MLIKMIKSSIFKNKTQKALAFLTCFLASSLICTMLNITLSIGNEITKDLRNYGSNILVLPKGSSLSIEIGDEVYEPLKDKNYLEEKDLHLIKEIFWRNNITAFAPFLEGKVLFNQKKEALIMGTYFDKLINVSDEEDFKTGIKSLYPLLKLSGKWASDDSLSEVMIGEDFAKNNALKEGDFIELGARRVQVVGILAQADKMSNKIITSLALAGDLLGKKGLYSKALVSALTIPENDLAQKARRDSSSLNQLEFDAWYCTAYAGSIAYQIEEDLKGSSAKVLNSINDAQNLVVKKIQSLMAITSILCIIAASIAISSLMSSELHRRKKEIGLLKVLGANTFQIYLIFASENLVVALIASVFGFAFGILNSQLIALTIFDSFISIAWIILPLSLIFAGLIAILGCLLQVLNISTLSPVQVLYGK